MGYPLNPGNSKCARCEARCHNLSQISSVGTQQDLDLGRCPDTVASRKRLDRYLRSVFRYLLAITRNAESAEELTQEFSLRFLRGDFQRADASILRAEMTVTESPAAV